MAGYVERDLEWIRGTTPTLIYRFRRLVSEGVYAPIEFDKAIISVTTGTKLVFREEMELSDPDAGEARYTVSAAQTRACKGSKIGEPGKNYYEIELRNGTSEKVYALGNIAAIGGANSDETDEDIS